MKIKSLIILLAFSPILSEAQSFLTGTTAITFTDPARSNRQIATDIFYPANTAGSGVPVATGTTAFPAVVFGHGFSLGTASYRRLADSLVSYGYVVAMPATETGLAPSHDNFGKDLAFVADAITALGSNSSSFLYQRISNKAAVSGHSMGGGCSFIGAATGNSSIKALFNFAAAETNPSATAAASLVNVPTLIFSGSSDCIVPPATQLAMYNNIPAGCKTYINITGGTHCQIANNNASCTFGQLTSGCNTSSINVDIFLNKSLSMLLPFLDYHLKGNCYRGIAFIDTYNLITGITSKQNTCPPPVCNPLAVNFIRLAGRMEGTAVALEWDTEQENHVDYYVVEKSADGSNFSELGRTNAAGLAGNHYEMNDPLPYAAITYYRVKALNADGEYKYSNIINLATPENSVIVSQVFPNPVINQITIRITSIAEAQLAIQLLALDGKTVLSRNFETNRGNSTCDLKTSSLAAGYYVMIIRDSEGRIIHKQNIIKK